MTDSQPQTPRRQPNPHQKRRTQSAWKRALETPI
jgi:hypothetical protein